MRTFSFAGPVRPPSLIHRCTAWVLVSFQLLAGLPAYAVEQAVRPAPTKAPDAPALVRTPANLTVRRALPAHGASTDVPALRAKPTDSEILGLRLFAAPLRPVETGGSGTVLQGLRRVLGGTGAAPSGTAPDNEAVAPLLQSLAQSDNPHGTETLEQFVAAHPNSRWSPALRHELARRQFAQGYFQRAIDQWESVWKTVRDGTDTGSVAVGDEVLSCLIEAAMGLSDTRRLSRLVGEAEKRPGNNVLDGKLERAKQAV